MIGDGDEDAGDAGEEEANEPDINAIPDERSGNTPVRDWRDGITDAKLRTSAGKYASLTQFVEAHNNLTGELSRRVRLPGPDAGEEDVAKFRKALGVPNDIQGYADALETPDGTDYDEGDMAMIEEFAEVALENNIPAPAFNAFVQMMAQRAAGLRESVVEQIEGARDEAEDALAQDWGNDYDRNVSMATRAAKAHGGADFVQFLNNTKLEGFGLLGDHPAMVKFLAQVGSKSDEHDMVLHSNATERQSAQERIDQIYEQTPPGSDGYKSKAVQRELQQLFEKVHGSTPVAGGR
jgi:hypothetical protein